MLNFGIAALHINSSERVALAVRGAACGCRGGIHWPDIVMAEVHYRLKGVDLDSLVVDF